MATAANTALWRALQPLRTTSSWLMTGAHPDDEWNGFLAWLAYGQGVRTIYACATRGEGGQNALGPERGALLGALRSREMELAAREIHLTLHWLGTGPANGLDDPIHDFGFAKSGDDTLHRWGRERLIDRLVHLIRAEQPDAISPTFLDVPGQHGHHQAVTRCTIEAAGRAADPACRTSHLPPWQVENRYLPAFSGGGGSYDDELPPPPETTRVDLGELCAPLHASWAQIGEISRSRHASQGMGRTLPPGPRPFPLHKLSGRPDRAVPMDHAVQALAHHADSLPLPDATQLRAAEAAIAEALGAWPATEAVLPAPQAAANALAAITPADPALARRLALKRRQLRHALSQAAPPDPSTTALSAFGTLRNGYDPFGELEPPHGPAPADTAEVTPSRIVRRLDSPTPIRISLSGVAIPPSWPVTARDGTTLHIAAPPGHSTLQAGTRTMSLATPHAGTVAIVQRETLRILRAPIAIDPATHVGVIAGDADNTIAWLHQLDIPAEPVTDETLATGDLARFTTLLIGVFGFGQRPALLRHRPRLIAWTEAGGTLVTLYHRPGDGWHDGTTPPRPLRIGHPSLRWRVTDPAAPVTPLAPDHPILTTPNRIGPDDWNGWVRERGLYFAAEWDSAYIPLLAMADPGEPLLMGALLTAEIGLGRHTHVALALHHQFDALVPGAFRLLANLVSKKALLF